MTFEDQEKAEAIARRNKKMAEIDAAESLSFIMGDRIGRRFMWNLLSECNVFLPVFDESHAIMAHREGRRNVGLMYLQKISAQCPEIYQVMVTENTIDDAEEADQ